MISTFGELYFSPEGALGDVEGLHLVCFGIVEGDEVVLWVSLPDEFLESHIDLQVVLGVNRVHHHASFGLRVDCNADRGGGDE